MSIETPTQSSTTIQRESGPGCLIQALWFIFIGWWLGVIAIAIAWFLNITIIGLPIGLAILNNIPRILSLQPPRREIQVIHAGGETRITESSLPQRNFFLRALYFVLIGWWWSAIWLFVSYFLCVTVILIPLSLEMFRFTPFMTTLKRY
ncbi:MAG: YccF domain-containing protein [Chloroflexi bacterium]|nr:YccF domain-containing protein [Chloroflexota bacterium]